jgi:hypothetical protein
MDRLINIAFTVALGVLMILGCIQLGVHGHYGSAIGCAVLAIVFGYILYKESR